MTILRWRWRELGGHVHVRVLTGETFDGTFLYCGSVSLATEDWQRVAARLASLEVDDGSGTVVQIKHEDEL